MCVCGRINGVGGSSEVCERTVREGGETKKRTQNNKEDIKPGIGRVLFSFHLRLW